MLTLFQTCKKNRFYVYKRTVYNLVCISRSVIMLIMVKGKVKRTNNLTVSVFSGTQCLHILRVNLGFVENDFQITVTNANVTLNCNSFLTSVLLRRSFAVYCNHFNCNVDQSIIAQKMCLCS